MGRRPPQSTPAENAAKWEKLADEERAYLLRTIPEKIGGVDGFPARVRDQANRAALDAYLQEHQDPGSAALRDMISRPKGNPDARPLLLNYRPPSRVGATDGLVAVSYGDPDLAQQTAVLVPGTKNNLASVPYIEDGVGKVRQLRRMADEQTREGTTAAVYWLGCKMPDNVAPEAIRTDHAERGHPKLTRFLTGLRAARPGADPGRTTLIGHSYGSVVVARAAAATPGFPVDAIVLEGNPGVGDLKHARELNIDPASVYVEAAPNDPVAHMPPLVHGTNPRHPKFGAQLLETGNVGHTGYWNAGSQALTNKVHVVTDQTDKLERASPQRSRRQMLQIMDGRKGRGSERPPSRFPSNPVRRAPRRKDPEDPGPSLP